MTFNRQIRCAIYTRKSSEEGLDQSFNSLQAQREACEAYVTSQKHEGWHTISARYDDGGFSGGSMERPALQNLLADIAAGKVNTVVVYKVDRLTRSLADFAKIIEAFDAKGISFVSVTQQFNTTTSMGRLTLNVLLSFAQFEREVTGERIRDKVAASKKKGMWMGGFVPLGYDVKDRQLIINPDEATIVRAIFQKYLELERVNALKQYLEESNVRSKLRQGVSGIMSGGKSFSRGALYHILNRRLYIGEIAHRGNVYPGQHEAIIDRETWDKVAALLAENNQGNRQRATPQHSSLLTGILFDAVGNRYTPTHAVKKGKRYRYYTSQATIHGRSNAALGRIPAHEIESVVGTRIKMLLCSPTDLSSLFSDADVPAAQLRDGIAAAQRMAAKLTATESRRSIRAFLKRVVIHENRASIEVSADALVRVIFRSESREASQDGTQTTPKGPIVTIDCGFQLRHRSNELRLVIPGTPSRELDQPTSLIKAIARAHLWYERIISGEIHSLEQLADQAGMTPRYVGRILRHAAISPKVVQSILDSPLDVRTAKVSPHLLSDWSKQATTWLRAQ